MASMYFYCVIGVVNVRMDTDKMLLYVTQTTLNTERFVQCRSLNVQYITQCVPVRYFVLTSII